MATDLLSHFWTLSPRLAHALHPVRVPESQAWETVLQDPKIGPVRLTGRMRELPGDELLVLVHGLGGSVTSDYMLQGAATAEAVGLSCLRVNLRGADRLGEDFYHAGLTADLHAALASPEVARYRRIYVLGYSLGGHVVLRMATEAGDERLAAVAAICSPLDLALAAAEIDSPGFGIYRWYILKGLATLYKAVAERRPVPFPVERLKEIRLIREWDDRIVAPRHGFADASDYYARASVAPLLPSLRVPALLLNSENDPMIPARAVRPVLERTPSRLQVIWVQGGHVAFPRGTETGLGEEQEAEIDAQVIGWLRAQP